MLLKNSQIKPAVPAIKPKIAPEESVLSYFIIYCIVSYVILNIIIAKLVISTFTTNFSNLLINDFYI
ncbi:hypothetical protein BANRA_02286 [Acinetobacter baumannii]|nr:hypothetical protein BANRA_02286 [Acinetobacter baumannii]